MEGNGDATSVHVLKSAVTAATVRFSQNETVGGKSSDNLARTFEKSMAIGGQTVIATRVPSEI